MKHLTIDSPARIDLSGGTLDIWPLSSVVKNATTINCTLNKGVCVHWESHSGPVILCNKSTHVTENYPSEHPDLKLFSRALDAFPGSEVKNFRLTVDTDLPRGSGLGVSSVILATILYGTGLFINREFDRDNIVYTARDIEAEHLHTPTGIQDYIAPLYGGLNKIQFPYGAFSVENLPFLDGLSKNILLVFTGISHQSAVPNWEIVKGFLDKKENTVKHLTEINELSIKMVKALLNKDLDGVSSLLKLDFEIRKQLPGHLIPYAPLLFSILERCHRIQGFRMCGAAGGGTVVVLCKNGLREEVEEIIEDHGLHVLKGVVPEDRGMRVTQ